MLNIDFNPPIVVGVDGSEDALRALDWASGTAARHGWPLRLVHAYQSSVAGLPAISVTLPPPIDEARTILTEARDRVASTYPELSVSVVHGEGPAPRVLLRESESARMLVVGREGLGRVAELVLGSVSLSCAMRAAVPVAIVPASWQPPPTQHGRIVVGVDRSANCEAAVRYAFEEAKDRDAELVALYGWSQPSRWPEGWPVLADGPRGDSALERVARASLEAWEEKYPEVAVSLVGEATHPAVALRKHAAEADLVVIGGRGHGTVTGMLLGSVARAILRTVDAPVVVVHQPKGE
jgi:nucleotide-binding universal stress UspA family protein